jgi:tripartite motif-containing protein 71
MSKRLYSTVMLVLALSACATPPSTYAPTAGLPAATAAPATAAPAATATAPAAATAASAPANLPSPVEFVSKITGGENALKLPLGVATDAAGDLYVVDAGSSRVQVFDPAGNSVRMWGSQGVGDGQFDLASSAGGNGIVVDHQGNVYVSDFSHRIQKFDSQGNFLKGWTNAGLIPGDPNPSRPPQLSLAVDSQDNLYVADFEFGAIEKFDSNGNFLLRWGGTDSADSQLYGPNVAVDGKDMVWVAEAENGRVQQFDVNGKSLAKFSLGYVADKAAAPDMLAADSEGRLYVLDVANARIVQLAPDGTPLGEWTGTGDGQIVAPVGITVDGQGNVYVSDTANDCVLKYRLTGG